MRARISARTFEHFVQVALLISGDEPPEWLPRPLHFWIGDLPHSEPDEKEVEPL
jgi:hypothetical protein